MGAVYSVLCKCEYHEDELMDGCGMAMQRYAIIECSKCKRPSSKYLGAVVSSVEDTVKNKCCGYCQCGGVKVYEVSDPGGNRCPGAVKSP